jgi:hypothetical protein
MNKKCFFWPFIVWSCFLFSLAVQAQENLVDTRIDWDAPKRMPFGEDQYLDLLYFSGAVYADSLPEVPLFTYRVKDDVPHFSHAFQLREEVYMPVSDEEKSILLASGFKSVHPDLVTGDQYNRKDRYSVLSFYPFRYLPDKETYEKLVSFRIETVQHYDPALSYEKSQSYATSSVLSTGEWFKLCVDETGIYSLSYADLSAMGVPLQGLQKSQIRLYGNGGGMLPEANDAFRYDDLIENAIIISGASDGVFGQNDYLLFYGQSPNTWTYDVQSGYYDHEVHAYASENCYFLTINQGVGKRISPQASEELPATHNVTTFLDRAYHQQDLISMIGSGRVWYGEVFETTLSRDFDFPFSDIDTGSPARVKVSLAARSPVSSSFGIRAGTSNESASIPAVNLLDYNNFFARDAVHSMLFNPLQASNVRVSLTYNRPVNTARGWLDYVAVNVFRNLRYSGSQMAFRNPRLAGRGNVAEFRISDTPGQLTIWDVTDRFNIKRQEADHNGSTRVFRVGHEDIREFIAFDGSGFLKPSLKGKIDNQNLHALTTADMIIVSPVEFIQEAARLADWRYDNDGLTSIIVTPAQIYNEFSSGAPDVSAIRNFMKMFYDRAGSPDEVPRYLLLFGNGTIDNKDNLGFGGNLIPTYQSIASLSPSNSFMTDDYFGLLADSEGYLATGLLDIGIGRFPVRNEEEARHLVDKVIRYDKRVDAFHPTNNDPSSGTQISNYDDWRNMIVFVADDGDFNTHFNHAERLTDIIKTSHPVFNIDKIYLDAYQVTTLAGGSRYPDVNRAINNRVNKGALLINYIGHGGVTGLAHERVVTFEDIGTWDNYYNMPVFMTATCEFSSFDQPDPDELSAGVRILLKPDGGAVALYTTTRLAWSGTNLTLNENFTKNAFKPRSDGQYPRLGDLIRIAKVESDGNVQPWRLKNFVLLGDPSMQMAYPEYQIITESVPDTIKAFQKVTVRGYVADHAGNRITNYHGMLYPTIYDKYNMYETLANASGSNKAGFSMRNSALYKGKAGIVDGEFSFSFVVPKDIAYNFDQGKISYYADDGLIDAHGYYTGFVVGGTKESFMPDNQGPDIRLFMNDTTFVTGGKTNSNPVLLAHITDESGINISGRIGHDIIAYLNDQLSQPIALNSYFEASLDSYQSGRVVYPFRRLEDGHHTLTLRAWDIHNNPSVASIDFYVVSSAELVLENLINYPNPLGRGGTNFTFSHNLPHTDLDIRIDILDLAGRLLKSLHSSVRSGGYTSPPIHWDGNTDGGHAIGNGVYVYRLLLRTPDGRNMQQTEKLLIVRD